MSARRNGNRARCQHEGCEKFAQTRGLCKAHGGGSRCRDPSCNKLAQSRGLCIAHGGGRRCQHEGCSKLAQSKGFCISHGGGRRCTVANCEKFSQVKGRCKSHSKLAENSDQEADGEETETEQRSTTSPPQPRTQGASESTTRFRIDYLPDPLGSMQLQRSQDALPLPAPRTFGLSTGMAPRQPLLPPHPMLSTIGNRENVHHQPTFGQADGSSASRHALSHRWEDPHKRMPSINSRLKTEQEELPPLPYTYNLPPARSVYSTTEGKQESDEQPQSFGQLQARFAPSRPPSAGALPTVSSMMSANAATFGHEHFVGHKHAEPTVEPTSIPLFSFLDRSKDTAASQHVRLPSLSSSGISATATSTSSTAPFSTQAQSSGGSPPLRSIVFPPLNRNNQNMR